MKTFALAIAAALALSSPAAAAETAAKAGFVNMAGEANGSATLTGTPAGVLIKLEVNGLPAGKWVGFHVHENGACDAAHKHESAGGHFNPGGKEHGYLAGNGPHAGDMPNLFVGSDGVARAEVFNAFVTLGGGDADIMGRALMIHGGSDDYVSQPSGKAGERYACAVIAPE